MKDLDMSKELQKLADATEKHLRKALQAIEAAEKITCKMTAAGDANAKAANPDITEAGGYVKMAKAAATRAGNRIPDLTVAFGGK